MPEQYPSSPPVELEHHHPEQEPDLRSIRSILIIGGALIGLTIVFMLWAVLTVDARTGRVFSPDPSAPTPEVVDRLDIELGLFDLEAPGLERRNRGRRRLQSHGWIDRDRGIAHIPIDQAMQLSLDQLQTAPSRQQGGRPR